VEKQTEQQHKRWEAMRAIVATISSGGEYEELFDTENQLRMLGLML
jgi:hypothetical protein